MAVAEWCRPGTAVPESRPAGAGFGLDRTARFCRSPDPDDTDTASDDEKYWRGESGDGWRRRHNVAGSKLPGREDQSPWNPESSAWWQPEISEVIPKVMEIQFHLGFGPLESKGRVDRGDPKWVQDADLIGQDVKPS